MTGHSFDWPALMEAGLGELRLTPDQFWALTPVELKLMLGRKAGTPPMTRSRLDALMAAYPDPQPGRDDGDCDERTGRK